MQPKPHLGVTLTIIYLALVSSCLAIYHLIVKFISDQDQQTMFASLLAWSATLFATIALLYTFKEWRNQKASDVIEFKAKMALAAIQGDKTLAQLSEQFDLYANQIVEWKKQLQAPPPVSLVVQELKPNQPTSSRCTLKSVNSPWRMIF